MEEKERKQKEEDDDDSGDFLRQKSAPTNAEEFLMHSCSQNTATIENMVLLAQGKPERGFEKNSNADSKSEESKEEFIEHARIQLEEGADIHNLLDNQEPSEDKFDSKPI